MTSVWVNDLSLLGRVALCSALGFIVGWEREVRGRPAGARTFALVCAGSGGLTALSIDAFPGTAEKLIAGIVSGIGFIGAGLVLRDEVGHLRGLTTASAIWATSSIGIMTGAGRFFLAGGTTLLVLLILEFYAVPFLRRLDAQNWTHRFTKEHERSVSQVKTGDSSK
jgi:putative Mg2+ transporter-C (MgtC) family protein